MMTDHGAGQKEAVAFARSELGTLARADEPIGVRTTYRVGGAAAIYVEVSSLGELDQLLGVTASTDLELLVLGAGSNLLVADHGFDGICLELGAIFATVVIDADDAQIRAGAKVAYPVLARQSASAGLAAMEWAVGIPGSVGGAVAMNAGGHGAATTDRLLDALVVDLRSGARSTRQVGELNLGYRRSAILAHDLVLEARFQLEHGDVKTSTERLAEIVTWRREHQPGGRNGGSVFTNPPGDSAGRLIEEAGLKGLRVGSAQVSDKHANFFLADRGGRADDVYALIEEVRRLVAERLGIELETELHLIGFER